MELSMGQSSVFCDPLTHNQAEPNTDKKHVSGNQRNKRKRPGTQKEVLLKQTRKNTRLKGSQILQIIRLKISL